MKFFSLAVLVSLTFCLGSCQRELIMEPGAGRPLKLSFKNVAGKTVMQPGTTYQNSFGEPYTVSMFKYYISNIKLQAQSGNWANVDGVYHLVDEADSSSKSFEINVPEGVYTRISFIIGVDSIRNVSGTQAGDLDPLKGMFWTWNTGYVMAKLEGTSPLSTAPNQNLTLHAGGFRTGENTIRQASPAFPPGSVITVRSDKVSEVFLEADANSWFTGPHQLRIADHPVCTNAGELAVKFADNYRYMFKIVAINN
ncbi:hypothetical protein EXU57_05495 [Segetibacter sp. 3557_3]|uniref:MbnP family protein n=1 Tax=Segetibacter sp. 3557_3 TaxID=2547429 RepID=UPI0010591EA9|nr:MbnP family protein [Segetibacter sp. 3557_3]TDH27921.1 hypothetical protein EXU57_05495 [Segetibacter sp. 3557_3]